MNYKPILIIGGEPNSVFFEIFFKTIKKNRFKSPLIIIASKNILIKQMKALKFKFNINVIDINYKFLNQLNNQKINIINVDYTQKKIFEDISIKSNIYIDKCFKIALEIMKKNRYTKIINGPISKKYFLRNKHLGVTEYLAKLTNTKKFAMLIYNKKLSVSPITTHLPLKNVHKHITKKKIQDHVKLIETFYNSVLKKKPKIAITGLNPHCESNFKASEEDRIIIPAIRNLIKKKNNISGPYAADTIFMNEHSKNYDVIIGMYHDQVLGPIKTIFGFDAINITLGLPFIRISPDHGPNVKMLGKNTSNALSLTQALRFLDK